MDALKPFHAGGTLLLGIFITWAFFDNFSSWFANITDPVLSVICWTGYILMSLSFIAIVPVLIMMSDTSNASILSVCIGYGLMILGIVVASILNMVGEPLTNVMGNYTTFDANDNPIENETSLFKQFFTFVYIMLVVILTIIVPLVASYLPEAYMKHIPILGGEQ